MEPRSSNPGISGTYGDALKIRLSSAPVEGRANAELVRVIAKALGLRKHQVELISGRNSKRKSVRLTGISPESLESIG